MLLYLPPSVLNAPTRNTAINETINTYSISVAPEVFRSRDTIFNSLLIINFNASLRQSQFYQLYINKKLLF
jgi:hypothetical protein